MNKTTLILLFILFLSITVFSQKTQELFISKEFSKAYKKQTRAYNGESGVNYFVNQVDYNIKASFNPKTRVIDGTEIITYHNNSGDTLEYIYFNLYMDLFKKGNARDWDMGVSSDLTNGVNIKQIIIKNQQFTEKEYYNNASILKVKLKEPILPNSICKVQLDWDFIFPEKIKIRSGQYGEKNFFIAYWYPKIAVYDDIVGWNTRGHTGVQEFYNDAGDYNVELTVPGDYTLWSTAILQNTEELYNSKYVERIKRSKTSEDIIHIISQEDREEGKVLKKSKKKTWKFKSENTPDFAFALSKTYLWDATSVQSGEKRISINTAYKEESRDFKDVAKITQDIIRFYTDSMPGIPYPYPQFTAFNGGGGMEFPGMVNDGDSYTLDATKYLTAHELGHSYFPFYTGLNEQKYAWMDEGLITFFPQIFVFRTSKENEPFFRNRILYYNQSAASFLDVPLMIPSDDLSRVAYRTQAYSRSSSAFYELYRLIGEEKFSKSLQLFTERWHGKHPIPFDLFFTFNQVVGEDLAWFWKPWFFEMGAPDLTFGDLETRDGKTFITVNNKSGFPVEISLQVIYTDESVNTYRFSSRVWKDTNNYAVEIIGGDIKELRLDYETTPDAYPENNIKIILK